MVILPEEWVEEALRRIDKRVREALASRIDTKPETRSIATRLRERYGNNAADKLGELLIEHEDLHEESVREALGYLRDTKEAMKIVAQIFKASGYNVYKEIRLDEASIDLYAYREIVTSFGSLVPAGGSVSETIMTRIATTPDDLWEALSQLRRLSGYSDKSMIATSPYTAFSTRSIESLIKEVEESGIGIISIHGKKKTGEIVIEPATQPRNPARYLDLLQRAQTHKRI